MIFYITLYVHILEKWDIKFFQKAVLASEVEFSVKSISEKPN